jgi:phosphoribosyl-dephospho-CoA transferase
MLAPFVLLRALLERACLVGWTWGPTGSTAFELATGVPTVHASSDLDVLMRAPAPVPADEAHALLHQFESCAETAGIRVDVQLETPAGGVALAEWARHKPRTLVKRADGPCLIADPWSAEFAHCGSDD